MSTSTFTYTILHNVAPDHFLAGYIEGDRLVEGHHAAVEAPSYEDALDDIWVIHNRDNRPDGKLAPSLSVGDVILLWDVEGGEDAFKVVDVGFHWIDMPENVERTKTYLEVLDEARR